VTAAAHVDGDQVTLSGTKRYVVCAGELDELAVVVRVDDGFAVAVVASPSLRVESVRSLDPSRAVGHVTLDGVQVPVDRLLPMTEAAIARATDETIVAFALELVGTCQTIFDTNLQYAKERRQFGVPIGSFQAVKHKLANMFVAIERARAVAIYAIATIEDDSDRRPLAAAMAKAAAGECQKLVAQDGIQLLGGIGYTWEHDQHLFVKRAKAGEALLGTATAHRARVAHRNREPFANDRVVVSGRVPDQHDPVRERLRGPGVIARVGRARASRRGLANLVAPGERAPRNGLEEAVRPIRSCEVAAT